MNKKIDYYLENIQEGKVWDKAKKIWKKNKKKIKTGAAIAGTIGLSYLGGKALAKNLHDTSKKSWKEERSKVKKYGPYFVPKKWIPKK